MTFAPTPLRPTLRNGVRVLLSRCLVADCGEWRWFNFISALMSIAHELLKGLKANVSIDWAHRDSARARLRVLVKRILRRYGYPPDLEDAAVRGVLTQAEAMLAEISV